MESPPRAPEARPIIGHTGAVMRDPLDALERYGQTDASIVSLRCSGL